MDDRMDELFNNLPEPSEGDSNGINPWHRPLTYLAWGIFITTVTFNFLNLDQVLPPVGFLLMYLGLRPLRRENGGFKAAYVMAVIRIVLLFLGYAIRTMPFYSADAAEILTVPVLILQVTQLVAIRAGLAEVFDRTGTPRRLAAVNWLSFFNLIIALGALFEVGEMGTPGLAMIAGYIAVIAAVARLPKSLGDAGCTLRNAPVKLSDKTFSAVMLCSLLAVTLAAWFAGLLLSVPKAQPFTTTENAGLAEKMPAEIVETLTGEDTAFFDGAENIQFDWSGGDRSLRKLDDDLRLCTVTAQLPEAKILILQYFHWDNGGPKYGDGISLWHSVHLTRLQGIRSNLVYERRGQTLSAPLVNLTGGVRSWNSVFTQTSADIVYGDIYVPLDAENTRGYVMYVVSAGTEQWTNYNCQINYYHRSIIESFDRLGSPSETLFSGDYGEANRAIFLTVFSAWEPEYKEPTDGAFHVNGEPVETVSP